MGMIVPSAEFTPVSFFAYSHCCITLEKSNCGKIKKVNTISPSLFSGSASQKSVSLQMFPCSTQLEATPTQVLQFKGIFSGVK